MQKDSTILKMGNVLVVITGDTYTQTLCHIIVYALLFSGDFISMLAVKKWHGDPRIEGQTPKGLQLNINLQLPQFLC